MPSRIRAALHSRNSEYHYERGAHRLSYPDDFEVKFINTSQIERHTTFGSPSFMHLCNDQSASESGKSQG